MSDLPLGGIRILELGGYIAAPYATSLLGTLGAEVVKVERPDGGDAFRRGDEDRYTFFRQYNAGKKSVAVNLKHPAGIALVKALVPRPPRCFDGRRPGRSRSTPLVGQHSREVEHLLRTGLLLDASADAS